MTHTPETLADRLGLSIDAIRKKLKSLELVERFQKAEPLPAETEQVLISHYAEKGRTEETRTAAAEILGNAGTDEVPAPAEVKPQRLRPSSPPRNYSRKVKAKASEPVATAVKRNRLDILTDLLLTLVTVVAMAVQIVHTKTVVAAAKPIVEGQLAQSDLQHWGYAFAIQFTGLAMTLYNGKRIYLQIFAVAEFFINLFYFEPWELHTVESWTLAILLSGLIAFTIYSYAEVYAARRRANTDEG